MNDIKYIMFPTKKKKVRTKKTIVDVLFVDPGLMGTGFALFPKVYTSGKNVCSPSQTGVFRPKGRAQWETKVESVCAWFEGIVSSTDPRFVVIEFPGVWSSTAQSIAATQKGDLFKLTYLIGGMAEVIRKQERNIPILISPSEWKGQLPKDVVINRIKKRCPELKKVRDHEADAIGMGLSAQGGL